MWQGRTGPARAAAAAAEPAQYIVGIIHMSPVPQLAVLIPRAWQDGVQGNMPHDSLTISRGHLLDTPDLQQQRKARAQRAMHAYSPCSLASSGHP